ncbi:glycerophosphodiester phosphodiesterase [Actinospongicola halichondriae]|uniref:glycerophosphodiester phosphodiesterase n=1 Tax=Actinospongicola halichondriae TaxID=3236844 RepID=UPI003D588356
MHKPQVFGHRGASAAAPENTLEAYDLARVQGADGVELDVRRTVDGALVLHHDAQLPGGRIIAATTHADLPASIPTLEAALDTCVGMVVNIEIKNIPGEPDFHETCTLADEVVALLSERAGRDRVLISSFHLATIDRVKVLDPEIRTGFLTLVEPTALESVRLASKRGHDAINPYFLFVDEALIDAAHGAGLEVNAWTVNEPDVIAQLASLGIDGIVTDVPDVAVETLDGRIRPA